MAYYQPPISKKRRLNSFSATRPSFKFMEHYVKEIKKKYLDLVKKEHVLCLLLVCLERIHLHNDAATVDYILETFRSSFTIDSSLSVINKDLKRREIIETMLRCAHDKKTVPSTESKPILMDFIISRHKHGWSHGRIVRAIKYECGVDECGGECRISSASPLSVETDFACSECQRTFVKEEMHWICSDCPTHLCLRCGCFKEYSFEPCSMSERTVTRVVGDFKNKRLDLGAYIKLSPHTYSNSNGKLKRTPVQSTRTCSVCPFWIHPWTDPSIGDCRCCGKGTHLRCHQFAAFAKRRSDRLHADQLDIEHCVECKSSYEAHDESGEAVTVKLERGDYDHHENVRGATVRRGLGTTAASGCA